MRVMSKTSDFNLLGFLLGIVCCVLMGVNLVIAHTGFANVYFLAFALISAFFLCTNFFKAGKPVLVLFFILGFPEYGASPYDANFFSPFYFQKYVILLVFLSMFTRIKFDAAIYGGLIFASWLLSFYFGINGSVAGEIFQLFILGCLLNIKFLVTDRSLVSSFLLSFIAFCFISSLIVEVSGYSSVRLNGGEAYLFGHWFGILVGYFILNIGKVRYPLQYKLVLSLFLLISIYMNINTFQSAHIVFIGFCLIFMLRMFEEISLRSILLIGLLVTGL